MTGEFVLPEQQYPGAFGEGPFQILALSGGGYRGIYSALLLEELETLAGKPLAKAFHLVAGTSIGGILAIGLAAGVPALDLRKAFMKHGRDIFPRSYKVRGVPLLPRVRIPALKRRYPSTGLKRVVEAVLEASGGKKKLGDLTTPVLIASVDATSGLPRIFGAVERDKEERLVDIALATSAAPTYFAEHGIGTSNFVDGGIIANAPDALAIARAIQHGIAVDRIAMLSLGTVGGGAARASERATGLGWIFTGKRLFELTLAAQQELSCGLAESQLKQHYLRLDAIPSKEQAKAIALDRVDAKAVGTLQNLAQQTIRTAEVRHPARLRQMLSRTATPGAEPR